MVFECDFCGKPTDLEKVSKGAGSYTCGGCVQFLSNQSQEDLLKGYTLAIERGYLNKATAIKSFMEVSDEPERPEQYDRHIDRAGITRPVRNEKRGIERFEV